MATAHLHLPHLHVPHVGQPQDQAHRDGTRPSHLGGIILGIGMLVAVGCWAASVVALLSLGPARSGTVDGPTAGWTALAIASAISLFVMGIWKAHRA